jgi:hypothetical protein
MKMQFTNFLKVLVLGFFVGCGVAQASHRAMFLQDLNQAMENYAESSAENATELAFLRKVRACVVQEGVIKAGTFLREAAETILRVPKVSELYYNASVALILEFLDFHSRLDSDLKVLAKTILQHARPTSVLFMAQTYRIAILDKEPSFAEFIPGAILKGRSKKDLQIIIPGLVEYQQGYIDFLQACTYCFNEAGAIIPSNFLYNWAKGIRKITENNVLAALTVENLRLLIEQASQVEKYIQTVLPVKAAASFEHDKELIEKEIEKCMAERDVSRFRQEAAQKMRVMSANSECFAGSLALDCWESLQQASECLKDVAQAFVIRGDLEKNEARVMVQQLKTIKDSFNASMIDYGATMRRVTHSLIERGIIAQEFADTLLEELFEKSPKEKKPDDFVDRSDVINKLKDLKIVEMPDLYARLHLKQFEYKPQSANLMFSQGCWDEPLKAAELLLAVVQSFVDRGLLDEEAAEVMRQQCFPYLGNFLSVLPELVERKIISQAVADELLVRANDYFCSK